MNIEKDLDWYSLELFSTAVTQKDQSEVEKIAKFYDFIEVQPPALYQDLMDRELIRDKR